MDLERYSLEEAEELEGFCLKDYIADYPDFPKKGIMFRDISPLLANPKAFEIVINSFELWLQSPTKIVGLDARGFIFASALALKTWLPLVMLRKKGKLPWETDEITYDLEYGTNTFEIRKWSVWPWDKIAIVDDLLATGGSIKAWIDLIEGLWAIVSSVNTVIELKDLKWRELFNDKIINSLVEY